MCILCVKKIWETVVNIEKQRKTMQEDELVQAGTVIEAHATKSLVRVNVLGRETDWLPMLQAVNSYKRQFVPVRVDEQVVVLANRYVIGSIFNIECKEPAGVSDKVEVTEYEDGTRFVYDTATKKLEIDAAGDIEITITGNAKLTINGDTNIKTTNAAIEADSVNVKSQDIKLNDGKGVVTGAHICAFTGLPHSDCSATVTAGK